MFAPLLLLTPLSSATRRCPCPCLIGVLSFVPCRPRFCVLVVLSSLSPPHCPLPRPGPRCCCLPRRVPGGGWGRCCGVVALLSLARRVIVAPRYSGWVTVVVVVVVVASLGMGLSFWHHCVIVTQLDPLD